jgi:hypothetical protein
MTREHLPNRRLSETIAFAHEGHSFTGTVSYYPDGRPAELFLSTGKPGTGVETVSRDCAVAVSLALQHGVPLETLRHAITRLDDGTAAGPLGKVLDGLG